MSKLYLILAITLSTVSLALTLNNHNPAENVYISKKEVNSSPAHDSQNNLDKIALIQHQLTQLKNEIRELKSSSKIANTERLNNAISVTAPTPLLQQSETVITKSSFNNAKDIFESGEINTRLSTDMESLLKLDIQQSGKDTEIVQNMECRASACQFELVIDSTNNNISEPMQIFASMPNLPVPAHTKLIQDPEGNQRFLVLFNQ